MTKCEEIYLEGWFGCLFGGGGICMFCIFVMEVIDAIENGNNAEEMGCGFFLIHRGAYTCY